MPAPCRRLAPSQSPSASSLSRQLTPSRSIWALLALLFSSIIIVLSQQVDLASLSPEEKIAHLEALLAEARAAAPATPLLHATPPPPRGPPSSSSAASAHAHPHPHTPPGGAPLPPLHGKPHARQPGVPRPPPPPPGPGLRGVDDIRTATGYAPPPPLPPMPDAIRKYQMERTVKARAQRQQQAAGHGKSSPYAHSHAHAHGGAAPAAPAAPVTGGAAARAAPAVAAAEKARAADGPVPPGGIVPPREPADDIKDEL